MDKDEGFYDSFIIIHEILTNRHYFLIHPRSNNCMSQFLSLKINEDFFTPSALAISCFVLTIVVEKVSPGHQDRGVLIYVKKVISVTS